MNLKRLHPSFLVTPYNPHMTRSILLASGNAKKLAELRNLCSDLPVRILAPSDLPGDLPDVEEDRPDFVGNAIKKAISASETAAAQLGSDVWALADDSGLSVDALDGAPGVYSARYASRMEAMDRGQEPNQGILGNSKDGDNNARLLQDLAAVPDAERGAAFHCVLALARAGQVLCTVEGKVEGTILREADGAGGFGYDPLFFHPPSGTTFARLGAEQKAAVSHRGEAVRKLHAKLKGLL